MIPGPPRITLDQESFKALASDVRVGVLKVLDERRQTVTDLSNRMSLSKPTLLEHLEKLQSAGLVKRVDEGRKWIYYELSEKGRKILHPEKVSIVVALSSAAGLAAIGVVSLLSSVSGLLSGPGRSATDYGTGAAPMFEAITPGTSAFAFLFFFLAGAAVGAAFLLRLYGARRRDRLFAHLSGA